MNFVEKLKKQTKDAIDNKPNEEMTEQEFEAIVERMKEIAEGASKRGSYECSFLISSFKRLDEKNKGIKIKNGKDPKIIEYFETMGLKIRYGNNMSCGMCNMRDCDEYEHYGYTLSWSDKS